MDPKFRKHVNDRIIGGHDVDPNSIPFQVHIFIFFTSLPHQDMIWIPNIRLQDFCLSDNWVMDPAVVAWR